VVFGMITLIANTVIYFPLFYLLLGWLSSRQRNKEFYESNP